MNRVLWAKGCDNVAESVDLMLIGYGEALLAAGELAKCEIETL